MPFLSKLELIDLAKAEATAQKLDPILVCAVCENESSWNVWASRYEDLFWNKYIKKLYPNKDTESIARATSYGVMQVLGQVARELGFSDSQLSDLMDPRTSIKYGCLKLASALKKSKGDVTAALLAYNGGSDKSYPDRVKARMKNYQ